MNSKTILRSLRLIAFLASVVALAGQSDRAQAAALGTVNLGVTPPDLSTNVDPNILVTFDDSGSMASDFMGDFRPFDGGGWSSTWYCAGVIDARYANPADPLYSPTNIRAKSMNGVYYNPNVLYVPPVLADGSSMPQANATLTAVEKDGVQKNRPLSASSAGTTNFTGTGTSRWKCPGDSTAPLVAGGPYYYRLKTGVNIGTVGAVNTANLYSAANWDAVAVPNTTAVIQGVTINQWQNWANWYSYYRTRNLMTRSALSRVFGNLGSNIRVGWQNINDSRFLLPATALITNLYDVNAYTSCSSQNPTAVFAATAQPGCYRSAFFNWIFQVPASGGTPDRAATIRAGDFFKRGNGNTGATGNLLDPYWQPANATTGAAARELSCRQNFHMLVTDGYWNEGDPTKPTPYRDSQTSGTLPDAIWGFTKPNPESRVFWDVVGTKYDTSLANIAFNYWATDLRSDLTNNVSPYMPDKTTNVTGSTAFDPTAAPPANDPRNNKEIYFNPANDPATWQHVVQFMVTLGIAGQLTYSDDVDGSDPANDLFKLRKGLINSSGVTGWPTPVNNSAPAIDDTWHAAINSRGSYFSASDPGALVNHLTEILSNVLVRSTTSTQPTLSLPFAFSGVAAFSSGYDSGDWSGTLTRVVPFDAAGNQIIPPTRKWEAGCTLTGGLCPNGTQPTRDPNSRQILTSKDGSGGGIPFQWASLTTTQQKLMNADPTSIAATPISASWTLDGNGLKRVDYIRGARTYEITGIPQFRRRGSVLGAIVNSQPVYNASPESGWSDNFPAGSPEALAVHPGNAATDKSYARFVHDNASRPATVYAGSNDGMLHAFDATNGVERWAYVPNALIANGNLVRLTDKSRGLTPGVDNKPRIQDVFLNGSWRTVLVGSLRLGGRGLFAIDITDPNGVSEASAATKVMWEYSNLSTGGARLGYTYSSPNIVRLNTGAWAVIVASSYFPNGPTTNAYDDPASVDAAAAKTSLLVIDLATGNLIKELPTTMAPNFGSTVTYGLSTPGVYDVGGDQVDDLAVAGDLAGNVWRFDLTSSSPAAWKVDLMFKTYPSAATTGTNGTCTAIGQCPVSVMPVGLRNPATRGIVWVFGTGKFLGPDDRSNAIPAQSFYGVYDAGTAPTGAQAYPILPANMMVQKMKEDTLVPQFRYVTLAATSTPATVRGWTIALDIVAEQGERNVVTPQALDQQNAVILPTLIPTSDDPCTPGRRGALIIVDAATGAGLAGGSVTGGTPPGGYSTSGQVDTTGAIPTTGDLSLFMAIGGGTIGVSGTSIGVRDSYWYRSAWRELLDFL